MAATIDEVRIYNRSLSASEVAGLYNGTYKNSERIFEVENKIFNQKQKICSEKQDWIIVGLSNEVAKLQTCLKGWKCKAFQRPTSLPVGERTGSKKHDWMRRISPESCACLMLLCLY